MNAETVPSNAGGNKGHRLVEPHVVEGVGDGMVQLDAVVERDIREHMRRSEVVWHGQVEEDGGRRSEWRVRGDSS